MAYRLFTTYYHEPSITRRRELDLALKVSQAAFDYVTVLAESVARPDWFRGDWWVGEARQTFCDMIALAANAGPGDVVAIANCDVIVPRSELEKIDAALQPNEAYCLTRWELDGQWAMQVWDVGYSQDVWVFRGPPRASIGGHYGFGLRGCDNRFSHELAAAGYDTRNPSKTIETYHVHNSGKRTETNTEAHRVPPPYLYLTPVELGAEQPRVEALTLEERKTAFRDRRRSRRHPAR